MPKVRYLCIRFDQPIMPYEIPFFRAAVIEASGRKSSLFHNHNGQDQFIYRYPLIQYKVLDKKASIVCLNEGTDDIHYLLQNREFYFDIQGRMAKYEIEDVCLKYVNIQTWQDTFTYNILNWLPLNQDNYRRYQDTATMRGRLDMLENILRGHFQALATGIGWDLEQGPCPLEVNILDIKNERYLEHKGQHLLAFHLNIRTNAFLPDFISIGKGASSGFGIIKQVDLTKRNGHALQHHQMEKL